MSKLKSRSLNVTNYQDDALKQHVQKLMELSQEIVADKLQRIQEKQRRIEAVEKQFISWADRKQNEIRQKIQKSSKNKEEHISKIVKKCKDNQKYLGEKLKNYQNKKKESLREAWKMTQKYKNNMQEDRNMTKSKSISNNKSFTESRFLDKRKIPEDKKGSFQINTQQVESSSKKLNNKTKDHWGQLNNSKQRQQQDQIRFLTQTDEQYQERQVHKMEQKLKEAFSRFKDNLAKEQQSKIQQLGERFEKIQKSRNRKIELTKKKREKYHHFNEQAQYQRRNKLPKKSQRVHSETIMREKRVHDWSEANKNKRQEFFQNQLQNGNEYLQNSKLKFLKTAIAKKITMSTIEKKLYLQRLKH